MEPWAVIALVLGAVVWNGVGKSLRVPPRQHAFRRWAEQATLDVWLSEAKKAYMRHDDVALWNLKAAVRYSQRLDNNDKQVVASKLSKYIDTLYTDIKEEF